MNHHEHQPVGSARYTGPITANFRVMARRKDGTSVLLSLAPSRLHAVGIAKRLADRLSSLTAPHATDNPIRQILVEYWDGMATNGRWRRLSDREGGFCYRTTKVSPKPSSGPTKEARCVLLAEKTRKGGWRAQVVDRDLAGPITNSASVPTTVRPGATVTLVIEAKSRRSKHVQFRWPER